MQSFLLHGKDFLMKRMRMYDGTERTFEEGVEEYVLDMKARNLRQGTISLIQKQATQFKRTCESLRNEQNYNLQVYFSFGEQMKRLEL